MSIYLDAQCDKCIHRHPNKDGWRGCCAAFPDGWPKGWLGRDKRDLAECNNGIKYEPKTERHYGK